jgi:23S rRNA (guanosine2251-2'-O)-methyltransferase
LLNELKQIKFFIYSADMSGDDVREVSFNQKKVLLLGSEGEGLSKKILNKSDKKISIKMARDFDSLNVSVAFAILCDRMR